jgi:hypothetical protein
VQEQRRTQGSVAPQQGKPRHNLLSTSGSLSRLDFLGENPLS